MGSLAKDRTGVATWNSSPVLQRVLMIVIRWGTALHESLLEGGTCITAAEGVTPGARSGCSSQVYVNLDTIVLDKPGRRCCSAVEYSIDGFLHR